MATTSADAGVASVLAWLKRAGSARVRAGMARYGLPQDRAVGIPVGVIQREAKRIGQDHALALAIWKTGWFEARMLAAFIGDPARLTPAQMDAWCRDFDNWGIVDTVCFKLFDRSPHAWKKAVQWARRTPEFEKRAGYVLMACLAAHDTTAGDAAFLKLLTLIEQGASDGRNFVKKGVSWALRQIGHRNAALNAAAAKTARRLAASEDTTERWVGKDALRDITRPAVLEKVRKRSAPTSPPR